METLANEDRSAILLKPLVYILIVWEILKMLNGFVNFTPEGYIFTILNTVVTIVSLYYNFQLFTNLANIAQKYFCPQKQSILRLRTLYTILITAVSLMGVIKMPQYVLEIGGVILIGITFFIIITTCIVLFGFKRSLIEEDI